MSKIEEACGPLGFNVRKQNYKMKLKGDKTGRKGYLSVATEVLEIKLTCILLSLCNASVNFALIKELIHMLSHRFSRLLHHSTWLSFVKLEGTRWSFTISTTISRQS
jgi:hypothetical protein